MLPFVPPHPCQEVLVVAHIELILRYNDDEVQVEIPLGADIPEVLRRVQLKRGCPHPVEETAHQVADDIREKIFDQRMIRTMIKDIVLRLYRSG